MVFIFCLVSCFEVKFKYVKSIGIRVIIILFRNRSFIVVVGFRVFFVGNIDSFFWKRIVVF